MDRRRAAGALLALAACVAYSAAAPTANNQTSLDLYEGAEEGCYYNFQHYGEGDRIMTNEPCLNCTCHNRMLMCYLRVCPFTKPIGQDCTVEKRADQCCPIVTCPDVPVDLLTSTSTSSPMEYGATGLGKLDMYGCSINGRYFPEGSKVPSTPNKPCEHCYCIRNMTTCVMQECTLHVDGCTPIYHKDVCCPVRYSCDHPEDEIPLLDDMTTTVRPTQGFLLTTTTWSPVTQMTQDCVHEDKVFPDGALIKTEKACEHCYCMKGDIVCVVQECGTPMENEGKNCTSLAPREGQCCPDTYICEGDDLATGMTELPTQVPTKGTLEHNTPKRVGDEGSGYTVEPEESYTSMSSMDSGVEGSGEEDLEKSHSSSVTPTLIDESFEYSKDTFDQRPFTVSSQAHEITTEADNIYNTISSKFTEEKFTEVPDVKTTVSSEGPKVTESSTIDVSKISNMDELVTSVPDLTTEKSFRKDDQGEVTKESFTQKEFDGLSTVIPDEYDLTESTAGYENIPSSEKTELKSTSTITPPHTLKEHGTAEPKEPSTKFDETPVKVLPTLDEIGSTVNIPESYDKTEPTETDREEIPTTLNPSRIPGEGDCLINGVTYRNESDVPSSNKCDLSCKCISSIVKCEPIICSLPPEFMDNCQAVYDTSESCCPTYICQSKETIPPQSHSQMSGTDSPLTKPLTECNSSDCLIVNEKEQHEVTDIPHKTLHCDDNENCIESSIPDKLPCKGESCTKVKSDCNSDECSASELSQKPEDRIEVGCLGENCRRKDIESLESKLPAKCNDLECLEEVPVISTVKPDISTVKPDISTMQSLQTEPATELSYDKFTIEENLGHKILDTSIEEKEPNTEYVTKIPYQTTEAETDVAQTTSKPIISEITEQGPEDSSLISYPTKVSTEVPEIATVEPSSEAENFLVNSETTPNGDSISYVTMTTETIKSNEPVSETHAYDTKKSDDQKPDIVEKEKEHIKDTDSFVTESELFTSTIPEQDSRTELPLSHVTQLQHTELPQEQLKVIPEEYETKTNVNEEPESFTSIPEYQTDQSDSSKTPEINTEIPTLIITDEENGYLTTETPEKTTHVLEDISSQEKEALPTELPTSNTEQQQSDIMKVVDKTITELPDLKITHLPSTEIPEYIEHGEEENEIPTKILEHKLTTDSYEKSDSEMTRRTESPTTSEELEKEHFTEQTQSESITTTEKFLTPENQVNIAEPEKVYPATKPPHYKEEEENEIPTELPDRKITTEDQTRPTIILESIKGDKEEITELPESINNQPDTEQEKQLPKKVVPTEDEYSTAMLEHTTYEPLPQETIGYEVPHQPQEFEAQTKIPQSFVTENQNPESSTSEIPEAIIYEEHKNDEFSTEKQYLTPELPKTMRPEVIETIDSLRTTEPALSMLNEVTSKPDEGSVTYVYEPSTLILVPESSTTTSEKDTTSSEILQSVSDYTRPHSSQEPSTELLQHASKTTAGLSENQKTTETLTSQEFYTTEIPVDIEKPEKVRPESVTTKLQEPEYVTEFEEILPTEIPPAHTSSDNYIVDQQEPEKETQTEYLVPHKSEYPEYTTKEPFDYVTEHKELSELPESITESTEPLLTKETDIEKNNEPENLPVEQEQIVTSIPEDTNETNLKNQAPYETDEVTTENPWSIESDLTGQFETGTKLSVTNDFITNQAETSTENLQPSQESEQYPSSGVTESSLELTKATDSDVPKMPISVTPDNQVQGILGLHTSTPIPIGETEVSTDSEVSEVPSVTTAKYEERLVTEKYDSVTMLNQNKEEFVSETLAPDFVPHEDGTQVQENTPKIQEFSTEPQTELPMSLITELSETGPIPSKTVETVSPEIVLSTYTPELSKTDSEKLKPSTEIPKTDDELSTKPSEDFYITSPENKHEIENIDKDQEIATSLPHVSSTQEQEISTVMPEVQKSQTEQHASSTESSINYDTVPEYSLDTDDTRTIASSTATPAHTESTNMLTESILDIHTEFVPEEAISMTVEKEHITESPKREPEIITDITTSPPEIGSTKYSKQPISESEEKFSDVVTDEQVVTENVDTTPYSVELDEHPHRDTVPEKPTHSTSQKNEGDAENKNKQYTTEKSLETEFNDITTTEFAETISQSTPHPILSHPVLPEKEEPDEKSNTIIPESETIGDSITRIPSDSLESHTTISSIYETVETEKAIKLTEKPLGFTTAEPSIPEEELILVTTKLTTIKPDEEKSSESPTERYSKPENEIIEEISTALPEQKISERPKEESTEKPELNEIHEEIPVEIPEEKLDEIPEEMVPESPKETYTKNPEEYVTETSLEQTSYNPEEKSTETPEEKVSEMPEVKPTVVVEEKLSEIPEEKPYVISDVNVNETPTEKPTIIPEDRFSEKSEEKPTETSNKKPSDIFEEKTSEIPEVIPTEVPNETVSEVPEEKLTGIPVEKPSDITEEKSTELPVENPVETFTEKSEKKPSEISEMQPTEMPEENPDEISTKIPEEKPSETPEEKPTEISEEKLNDIPEEKSTEMPTEKPAEIFTEMSVKKPSEISEMQPTEMPEENPDVIPTKIPEEKPIETPKEKPTEISEEKPNELPEEKLTEIPEQKPSTNPQENPIEIPIEKPSEIPEEKPSDLPVEIPQEKPDEISDEKISNTPSEVPEQKPSETPEEEIGTGGYGQEPDYGEEDQAFGPGTCRYGGKVYVSAQQIPRDDPCDFCFCFRSDIICLQQSCPPPIHGCHEEPIQGFCCPRYECPVSMATTLNVTTTTTTTTTTLPPHFPTHAYKGAAQRKGCLIKGHTYKVGEVVRASSGPCLHCTCGGDGQMKCDPKACTPEPMLRQMIAAAVSSKRRR